MLRKESTYTVCQSCTKAEVWLYCRFGPNLQVPSCSQEFAPRQKTNGTFLANWSPPKTKDVSIFQLPTNPKSARIQSLHILYYLIISLLGLFSKVWSFWRLVLVLAAWPIFWPPSTMSRSRQWHCPKHRWYPGSQRRVVDFSSFERCFRAEIVRILRIL